MTDDSTVISMFGPGNQALSEKRAAVELLLFAAWVPCMDGKGSWFPPGADISKRSTSEALEMLKKGVAVTVHNALGDRLDGHILQTKSDRVLVRGIWGDLWFALDALGYAIGEDALYLDVEDRERLLASGVDA